MPYYRIVVCTKRRKLPYQGIRLIGDTNINVAHQMYSKQGFKKYRENLIDVEVQMLSKLSTAVKFFERKEMSKKE